MDIRLALLHEMLPSTDQRTTVLQPGSAKCFSDRAERSTDV